MKTPIYKKANDNKEIIAFECTECEWQGTQDQKEKEYTDVEYGITEDVCPECSNPEFYAIVEFQKDE